MTDFGDPQLSEYAEAQMRRDTRFGIQAMAGLSLVMQVGIASLIVANGFGYVFLYTSLIFGLLSLHVLISAYYVSDVRSLHLLGMVFLVLGALAITALAHRSTDLNIGMMAAAVMLFVAIPLVPWALREVSIVIALAYLLLTSSLLIVPGRFESGSLWVLQLLLFGAAIIAAVVTSRNTAIRKQDLRARYELESAHHDLELLSMQDHLTGAWNRRYLEEKFDEFAGYCVENNKMLHVAILDIDDFKGINDAYGHDTGDKILISVADTFVRHLGSRGRLIRLGGDEFQIIYCGDDLNGLIESAVAELQSGEVAKALVGERKITLSAGIAAVPPGQRADLETLYKQADLALYSEKENRPLVCPEESALMITGSWRL